MLKDMSVMHPAAKMLVDLANAQDIEAGDGTTSVVVIAGSLLGAAERLLGKGKKEQIHRLETVSSLEPKQVFIPRSYLNLSNELRRRRWKFSMKCQSQSTSQIAPVSSRLPRPRYHRKLFHKSRNWPRWLWTPS